MKPLKLGVLLLPFILSNVAGSLYSAIVDPVPEPIEYSDLILDLEDWVQLPQSPGGGGGRARLSVMRYLPDGRLFVNDQRGIIYEIDEGQSSVYFNLRLRLSNFVDQPGLGTGFHSFAFHPDFPSNGKLYTMHSEPWNAGPADFKGPIVNPSSGGQMSVISEWTTANPGGATFSGTRRELFRVYFPGTIHAGQEIAFNPNAVEGGGDYGILYILLGEGGSYLKGLWENEQRLDSPMGTVFRIDPLGVGSANGQYGIPADNPFANSSDPAVLPELYALGFRNPHRIIWDRGGEGRAYIGDIGERQLEEINLLEAGNDYGFPQREGTFRLDPTRPNENETIYDLPLNDEEFGYTYPVAQYDHGEGRAIALGPVYRGQLAPELEGYLLLGDIVSGRIFIVEEGSLVQGQQRQVEEVRLRRNGIQGALTSFVGSSRADLRFGTGPDGEVYVMTKTDGWIRRVSGASYVSSGITTNPSTWTQISDFSDIAEGVELWVDGESRSAELDPDPYGGAENSVMKLWGDGTSVQFDVPAIPMLGSGSVYFRFALESEASKVLIYGSEAGGLSGASVILSFDGDGEVRVNDGGSSVAISDQLTDRVWYECWILFFQEDEGYRLYLRGGDWTAATLLASNIGRVGSGGSLNKLLMRLVQSGTGIPAAYLDDLYVDVENGNLSSPVPGDWKLISNFESSNSLEEWNFLQLSGSVTGPIAGNSVSLLMESGGNQALSIAHTPLSGDRLYAWVNLPERIEVSDEATVYFRTRVEDFSTNQVWGLVNVTSEEFIEAGFVGFEAIGRWTDEGGTPRLLIRDGDVYNAASGSFVAQKWYEVWLHVRNGGQASGGQTYDCYIKDYESSMSPELVYSDADFRNARETSIGILALVANRGEIGKTGAVLYDDYFLADGLRLDSPLSDLMGWPLPRGFFGESADTLFEGWLYVDWLGWVLVQDFPWVYHGEQGHWFYATGSSEGQYWFYDQEWGWYYTGPSFYPYLYTPDRGWIYYYGRFGNVRITRVVGG